MKRNPPEETKPDDHVWQIEKLIEYGGEKNERLIDYLQVKFPDARIHVQNVYTVKYPKNVPLIPDADSKEKRYKNVILNCMDMETREIHSAILSVDPKADITVKWVEKQKWYLKKRYGITTPPRDYVVGGKYDDVIKAFPELQSSDIASMLYSKDENASVSPSWISARKYVIKDRLSAPSPRSENCGKFDDVILGGLHNTPTEILSMIYSEDEDADVSYHWVGCRKTRLKDEHGVPKPPREWRPPGRPRSKKEEDVAEPKSEKQKRPSYDDRFDNIIISGAEDGLTNGEIMSAMLTEDEDAPKYVGWLSNRKNYLKEHDLFDEKVAKKNMAERIKDEIVGPHSPRALFVENHMNMGSDELVKLLNKKFTDTKINKSYVSTTKARIRKELGIEGKIGRPPSPRVKYIEGHIDVPNSNLVKVLNKKFPDVETTADYVSLMKARVRKRLGTDVVPTKSSDMKRGGKPTELVHIKILQSTRSPVEGPAPDKEYLGRKEEPPEKRPVKVDYTHKDVPEPEKIVRPKTGRRGRPPSPKMNLKPQTHTDTYEQKVEEEVEEPTKDYGIPAWKVPLQHEVSVPTIGTMRNTYVPIKDLNNIITIKTFSAAIKNSIEEATRAKGYPGVTNEQALEMAQYFLNFFGYSDVIIDNILETEDRNAFYMLEDAGLLKNEREETTLYDGREWRIHYWLMNRERINELAKNYYSQRTNNPDDNENVSPEQIYSEETWNAATKNLENKSGNKQLTGQERNDIYRKKRRGAL